MEIDWDLVAEDGGEDVFVMNWRESGGPPVEAPSRRGFGSTVLCRMAQASLNAKVDLKFAPSGLCWQLRCLAKHIAD